MSKITPMELYKKLLEIKSNDPNHRFNSIDLLQFGDVDEQMRQLDIAGKIILHNDIIDSFEVID